MKILICSDGMPAADSATKLDGRIQLGQGPLQADTTLLGIAEKSQDEALLREALEKTRPNGCVKKMVSPQIAIGAGDPVRQIVNERQGQNTTW